MNIIRKRSIAKLTMIGLLCVFFISNAKAANTQLLSDIKGFVLEHAPYKHYDPITDTHFETTKRTSAAACEAITFLSNYYSDYQADSAVKDKMIELADWVKSIQASDKSTVYYGGVPSTPDLEGASGTYHYSIDASFCGQAMLDAYRVTNKYKYFVSAKRFGEFLRIMQSPHEYGLIPEGATRGAFCDFIVGANNAWSCNLKTHNLIGLSFLKNLSTATGNAKYKDYAAKARDVLVEGLRGGWEFGHINGSKIEWHRITGPYHEPDHFVYGDTISYALQGLHGYEGLSEDVKDIYELFTGYDGHQPNNYDGRIALAGYVIPSIQSPDYYSSYYDIVTLGILSELRNEGYSEDFNMSLSLVNAMDGDTLYWNKNFDFSIRDTNLIDITTLVHVGNAIILDHKKGAQ